MCSSVNRESSILMGFISSRSLSLSLSLSVSILFPLSRARCRFFVSLILDAAVVCSIAPARFIVEITGRTRDVAPSPTDTCFQLNYYDADEKEITRKRGAG